MSYVIKRVGTLPIVIVKVYDSYEADQSDQINRVLERMFEGETRTIWRIFDATDYQMSFQIICDALTYEITHIHWNIKDPRLKTVVVSNMEYAYLGVRVANTMLPGLAVPMFGSLKNALEYVRAEVEATQVLEF